MALDVKIIIDMAKPIGNVGFGCPLILEENAKAAKDYKEYSNLTEIVDAGYAETTDVYKTAQLMLMQEHAPSKIAVCSTTSAAATWIADESNVRKEWRQLVVVNSGDAETAVSDIMAAIEAQKTYPKMYYANLPFDDSTNPTVKGIERTVLVYYTPTDDIPVPAAALVGEIGGLTVGSYTVNNMVVKGIDGLELSQTEIDTVHKKGGITFVLSAGDVVASEGIVAGGDYIDNIDGIDWIKQQLEYKVQKVFNNNLKVPYTNAGIAMLEGACCGVMQDAMNKGIIESYSVNFALRENVKEEDRVARKYVGGSIQFSMAGAIHHADIYCLCSY